MWILAIHYAQGRTIHEYSSLHNAVNALVAWHAANAWRSVPLEPRLITLRRKRT